MPITDKVVAAKQIGEFLQAVISNGGFKLKYRITVDPPIAQNREWEHPEILVEFAGIRRSRRIANGNIRKFWWSLRGRIRGYCWIGVASCCGRLSCWRRRSCICRATNTRRYGSTAGISGRCGSTNCSWPLGWRRNMSAGQASLTGSDRCRRGSGESCIWRCVRKRICAPRVTARAEDVRWWYIPGTTKLQRQRNGNAGRFRSCTLCAAVSFSTLDSAIKSRFGKASRQEKFCGNVPTRRFFCASMPFDS